MAGIKPAIIPAITRGKTDTTRKAFSKCRKKLSDSIISLNFLFNVIQCLIIGFYSASRLKKAMLNYDEKTYKENEKNAIIVGIIITIIIALIDFLYK